MMFGVRFPNGTVISARGHYLLVGSQYSLANYGGTNAAADDQMLTIDLTSDRNVALFTGATKLIFSSVTRLDAVGFGTNVGGNCDLFREGNNLPAVSGSTTEHSFFRKLCDFVTGGTPLANNDSINVQFLLGVQQTGKFRFLIIVEALP
jgi:hypothetical protein